MGKSHYQMAAQQEYIIQLRRKHMDNRHYILVDPLGQEMLKCATPMIKIDTNMRYVRELEVWSKPGGILHPDFGKVILQSDIRSEGVPEDVFIGVSNIPSSTHCEDLNLSIQDGEFSKSDFVGFCMSRSLPSDVESEQSACLFLEYMRGACVAWIHLPEQSGELLLRKIINLLKDRDLEVADPYTMERIL